MVLRHIPVIGLFCWTTAAFAAGGVRSYPLDDRTVYTIRISQDVPTTCVFPGNVTAIEGAHVSAKAEAGADVLLSATPNTPYFSVRALKADATGALNVIYRGRVYVLCLVSAADADRAVTFLGGSATANRNDRAQLRILLKRALHFAEATAEYPELTSAVERAEPRSVTQYVGFSAVIAEVFHYEAENVLVFHVRLENQTAVAVMYDPAGLAVRIGAEEFPAAITEASGAVPADGHSDAWFAISGASGEGRPPLSANEPFSVVVPKV